MAHYSMTFFNDILNCMSFSPDRRYIAWLSVVAVAINYNLWFCTARMAFPYHNASVNPYWIICDFLTDVVTVVDVVVWQCRLQFVKAGDIIVSHKALLSITISDLM